MGTKKKEKAPWPEIGGFQNRITAKMFEERGFKAERTGPDSFIAEGYGLFISIRRIPPSPKASERTRLSPSEIFGGPSEEPQLYETRFNGERLMFEWSMAYPTEQETFETFMATMERFYTQKIDKRIATYARQTAIWENDLGEFQKGVEQALMESRKSAMNSF